MTTTTADKGEKECREAFEHWFRDASYSMSHYAPLFAAWQAAWNRRPTCEQQRTTNEGQDGLINDALYLVQAFENDCVATDYWRDIEEFRVKAARHLSSKQADPAEVEGKLTDDEMIDLCSEAMVDANLPQEFCFQNPSMLFGYGKACIERALNQRLAVKEGERKSATALVCEATVRDLCDACRHDRKCMNRSAVCINKPVSDDQQAKDAALIDEAIQAVREEAYFKIGENSPHKELVKNAISRIRALSTTKQEEV